MKKIINKDVNLIFALFLVFMPFVVSLISFFGVEYSITVQLIFWGLTYFIFASLCIVKFFINNGKKGFADFKLKLKKLVKNYYFIVVGLMVLLIIVSTIVNLPANLNLFLYLSYFLIVVCCFQLNRKQQKLMINLLLGVVATCCVMGFIDPVGAFMPGLSEVYYPFSLQFFNPNYIGYVVAMLATANFYLLNKEKKIGFIIFYSLTYVIFGYHLFLNGSFFPIASLFLVEIFMLIFVSIKNKKFQYRMLIMLLVLIPLCFLSDVYVKIDGRNIRTCQYNFFVECIAVFDNLFKTNLLEKLVGVEYVLGADGWDRSELALNAINSIFSSPKNILLGGGAGNFYTERPHMMALSLAMDFGVPMTVLFSMLMIKFFIECIKNAFNHRIFIGAMVVVTFLICMTSGAHICYYLYIFLIFYAFTLKELRNKNEEDGEVKNNSTKEEIENSEGKDLKNTTENIQNENNSEAVEFNIKNTQKSSKSVAKKES